MIHDLRELQRWLMTPDKAGMVIVEGGANVLDEAIRELARLEGLAARYRETAAANWDALQRLKDRINARGMRRDVYRRRRKPGRLGSISRSR